MNKEDYKQFHYLLAGYKWEITCNLISPNLTKETRENFERIIESIEFLLKSALINCETRHYDGVGVCADDKEWK